MALYHLSVKAVSRGGGRSAVACAAYRQAESLHDERTGRTHDYERKRGVEARMLLVPDGAGHWATMGGDGWAEERERLWNAAEAAERRKDARVAREYELALPHELDATSRRRLVAVFAGELVERFGVAVDAAIHAPGREGDARNWHAHVLTTTRKATPGGLGEKAAIELSDTARGKLGLGSGAAEIEGLREVWGALVNRELERAQVAERVDHRSYARQGRGEQAAQHLGPGASSLERKAARLARQREAHPERTSEPVAAVPEPVPESPAESARERSREVPGAAPAPVDSPREAPTSPPASPPAAERGPERARAVPERLAAPGGREPYPEPSQAAVRPSAGVYGAGAEPATRIGRRNAEIEEHNRALQVARAALEVAQRVLERLERGRRWAMGVVRGVGERVAAEREERAREAERQRQAQELARREEVARQDAARRAEQERAQRAEMARRTTQEQRDAARQVWRKIEEAGRGARDREAEQARQRQERESQAPRYRGPSPGM